MIDKAILLLEDIPDDVELTRLALEETNSARCALRAIPRRCNELTPLGLKPHEQSALQARTWAR